MALLRAVVFAAALKLVFLLCLRLHHFPMVFNASSIFLKLTRTRKKPHMVQGLAPPPLPTDEYGSHPHFPIRWVWPPPCGCPCGRWVGEGGGGVRGGVWIAGKRHNVPIALSLLHLLKSILTLYRALVSNSARFPFC